MEAWKEKAWELAEIIKATTKEHTELAPLHTAVINFTRKHQVHRPQIHKRRQQRQRDEAAELRALLDRHSLVIISKQDVDRYQTTINSQADEIRTLEYRINTLLRP